MVADFRLHGEEEVVLLVMVGEEEEEWDLIIIGVVRIIWEPVRWALMG